MGAHNETAKLVAKWERQLRPLGWRVEKTAKHYKFIPPDPDVAAVIMPSSMGRSSLVIVVGNMRRAGAPI